MKRDTCSRGEALGSSPLVCAPPLPEGGPSFELAEVVDQLCRGCSVRVRHARRCPHDLPLPSRQILQQVVEDLRAVLFPGYFGTAEVHGENLSFYLGATLDSVRTRLEEQVRRGICFACTNRRYCPDCDQRAAALSAAFLARLPELQAILNEDAQAAYEGDPAASSPDETIFCYPGMVAITNHRLAHALHELQVPLIPRIINELAHASTGIDIHPGATIGPRCFIDHGTGVVIGETAVLGARVRIYQGVTLGAKSFPLDENGRPIKGIPRHPLVEDDVVIYSGATILGRVTIGRGSIIGGNVWLTRSVPPGSRVTQVQPREELFEHGAGI